MKRSAEQSNAPAISPLQDAAHTMYQLVRKASLLSDSAELHALLTRCNAMLTALYSVHGHRATCALFDIGLDILFKEIIPRVSRLESVAFMWSLRRVCKLWYDGVVVSTPHLNFNAKHEESCSHYHDVLSCRFPCARSVYAHRAILQSSLYSCYNASYAHVTHLEIERYCDVDNEYTYDARAWPNLQTLVFGSCDEFVEGIAACTSLTRLEISEAAFFRTDDLLQLVNLRHLCLRHWDSDVDLTRLTALRYLESDWPAHFAGFTGDGVMTTGEEAVTAEMRAVVDRYWRDCWSCELRGRWSGGVFTGAASVWYGAPGDDCASCPWPCGRFFEGRMRDGRVDGPGREYCAHEHVGAVGHWRGGVRHGAFEIFCWAPDDGHCRDFDAPALRTEQWVRGELTQ
jgi:hypothetical protein